MDNQEAIVFLFTIAKEIKRSFKSPVILMTVTDYAASIFNSLVDIRAALLQHEAPERVLEIVSAFHHQWLQAVEDVENLKKRIRDIPREVILRAVEFTKECAKNRLEYFQKYIQNLQGSMSPKEFVLMQADLETIGDMQESVIAILNEKYTCFQSYADQTEYYDKVEDETEELLNWLDTLNDNLAVHFSRVVGLKFPYLTSDLSKTLQQIIEEVAATSDHDAQKVVKEMQHKGHQISCLVGVNDPEELEIRKVLEKIKNVEDRIDKLKYVNSSAVMALQHKALYLEERLLSLENLKTSLYTLKNKYNCNNLDKRGGSSDKPTQIFDHLLPAQERRRLVEQLVNIWKNVICGTYYHQMHEGKSIISILSAADIREICTDELGKFTVDKFGRKVYADNDGTLYQVNEKNQLVEMNDDDKYVYFYDSCGRYYINEKNQRTYKVNATASEYLIDHEGLMLKVKEVRDGIEYHYDSLGRFYLNESGKRLYNDPGSKEEYERDGLGNLVLIRRDEPIYEPCPIDTTIAIEDNKYLQRTVGDALKKCIAEVVIQKPVDPIGYLANCLVKHQCNIQERQKRLNDEMEMMAERNLRTPAMLDSINSTWTEEGDSQSNADLNFIYYKTMAPKDD